MSGDARAELVGDQARHRVRLLARDPALLDREGAGVADHEDVGPPATRPSTPADEALRVARQPGDRGPPLQRERHDAVDGDAPPGASSSRPHDQSRTMAPARSAIPPRTRSSATASDVTVPKTPSGASSAVTRVRETPARTPRRRSRRSVWRASS